MRETINETCQICGHGCFKDWGYMQFHCGQCGAEICRKPLDYNTVINAESSSQCKPSVFQICELLKTLSYDQQTMVIKRALDHYNCEELCTEMAICLGLGKSEPFSQCEPMGSQFSESLKTLDGNQNQVTMTENIDKSALDDDEDEGLDNGDTLVKAESSSQFDRGVDLIWELIQGIDQDEYSRLTRRALDDYKSSKLFKTLDIGRNQGDMVTREMQMKPYAAEG